MRAVVLDNEAVQALGDAAHPKHRTVVAHLSGIVQRRRRGAEVTAAVPTAVRVEAGWDRSAPDAAAINRFRIVDDVLDSAAANLAAKIKSELAGVSVADAHLGATVRVLAHDEIVVLTSDPGDVVRVAGDRPVRAIQV
jgi:hypothetical protein